MDPTTLLGGRYRLGRPLGSGGMAEVRDGWDVRLHRPVAIKLLHPQFRVQAEMRKRFRDEALAAGSLNHPNIVSVFDSGEHNGVPYIVLERLPGISLADEIAAGPLSAARLRSVLDNVLSALDTAHRAGILHRDIKPGNILHGVSGDAVKLADFGISKAMDAGKYTRTGEMLGTMAYLSPERIAGAPASIADDLYALGVVGFESLTGRPRFNRDNVAALAHAIMSDRPPSVSALRPDVEPPLTAVIDRAGAADPRARFTDAASMRAALHSRTVPVRAPTKVLDTPPPHQPASLAYVPPRRTRTGRRTKILAAVGAGLFAAVATAVAVAAMNSPATPGVPLPPPSSTAPPPPILAPAVSSSPPPPEEDVDRGPNNGKGKDKDKKPKKGDG